MRGIAESAASLLVRALARKLGRPPADSTVEAVKAALEAVAVNAELTGASRIVGKSTRAGIASRYLIVEAVNAKGARVFVVVSADYNGWAAAFVMTKKQLRSSGLLSSALKIRGVEKGVLGASPLLAAFKGGLRAPGGPAYSLTVDSPRLLRTLYRRAFARFALEVDRALGDTIGLLASLPREPGSCDVIRALESLGWTIEAAGSLFARAKVSVVEGHGFVAAILLDNYSGDIPGLGGVLVKERAYMEACGRAVELVAEAPAAAGLLLVAKDEGLGAAKLGGKTRLRAGGVEIYVESEAFAAACHESVEGEPLLGALSRVAAARAPPLVCRRLEPGPAAALLLGGKTVIRMRLGALENRALLGDPGILALAPANALAAAVADPAGKVEVLPGSLLEGPVTVDSNFEA